MQNYDFDLENASLVLEKSIGIGKKNIGTRKGIGIGNENIWYQKKVSVSKIFCTRKSISIGKN